jgi:S-(hydroxymethyl)glutathione dehydrogenase / alcohol dehydrogenase
VKALVYHGAKDVRVDDKPKPEIKDKGDIILRVTSTALCGSDLHLYHGTVQGMEPGQTLGHEFMDKFELFFSFLSSLNPFQIIHQ